MAGGRPRTTTPSIDAVVELGKDLVKWATETANEKRTSFSFWYALKHDMILDEWRLLKQKPEFRHYYEKARAAMAQKIHNEELEKSIAHRYLRMFDRELADDEDEKAAYDASLKMKQQEADKDDLIKDLSDAIQEQAKISRISKANGQNMADK